jgi:hypothetical protein
MQREWANTIRNQWEVGTKHKELMDGEHNS